MVQHERKVAAKYHDYFKKGGFGSSLKGVFGGWGTWILHILLIGLMIFAAIVVIITCIKVIIGVCVCEKICHSDNDEVSLDRPSMVSP